jgi:hypothetical protein
MLPVALAETPTVVTVKFAVDWPCGITTGELTVAAELALETVTDAPPVGAGPFRASVAVTGFPPATLAGARVTDRSTAVGVTVSTAVFVTPPATAVIVALTCDTTVTVVTGKVIVFAAAGTWTDGGTVTEPLELESVTVIGVAGGVKPVSVIVPVEDMPPTRLAGLSVTAESAAGVTGRVALNVSVPSVAEIAAEEAVGTPIVVTVKVFEVVPEATTTFGGTVAAAVFELARLTVVPAAGAFPFRVTVPVDGLPPTTDVGERDTDVSAAGSTVSVTDLLVPE